VGNFDPANNGTPGRNGRRSTTFLMISSADYAGWPKAFSPTTIFHIGGDEVKRQRVGMANRDSSVFKERAHDLQNNTREASFREGRPRAEEKRRKTWWCKHGKA